MAYELDSEMRTRLAQHYSQVSDAELLDAVARLTDLTPTAQEVVHTELERRGLERAWPDAKSGLAPEEPLRLSDPFGLSHPDPMPNPKFGTPLAPGTVALITLYDAMEAGQACAALDQAGIEVEVRDQSQAGGGGSNYGGNSIALQLIVKERDRDAAVALLRARMGLFPLENIAVPDAPEDDGTVLTVGQFGRRADADDVARVLNEARIWNRVTANPEGSPDTEDAFLVGVKEIDLVRAGDAVEKALQLPEA